MVYNASGRVRGAIVDLPPEDVRKAIEVSAFGGFRGLTEGLGLDPAALYADHVLSSLRRGA